MQGRGNRAVETRQNLDVISVRRNPYLVEYEQQKQLRRGGNGSGRRLETAPERRDRRPSRAAGQRGGSRTAGRTSQFHNVSIQRRSDPAAAKREARKRRKRQQRRRRMMVCACLLCLLMTGLLILVKTKDAFAAEPADNRTEISDIEKKEEEGSSSTVIQGLSSEVYAKHPAWEEDFLPLNYYSRPGDALPEVKDIFVHYTANPGTSAAQNRSYFEQQKDVHEASVSAHFIIGYEGEIIQCVPLDEIAYAVQTRNYDSVSIECCYKAEDGSFTQETYDSLISLLAWLTEAYGLDADHILRHYDCGGKKCPLYYTEHEDAWVRLKEDVERSSAL